MLKLTSHRLQGSDLKFLVGEWGISSPQFPGLSGKAIFEWLEGAAYLGFRSIVPDPAPSSTWLIGADDSVDELTALYCDARGISRVYRMSLKNREWKIWRDDPGFSQRFIGRLSDDSRSIQGSWETSEDGTRWKHDFDLVYRKTR